MDYEKALEKARAAYGTGAYDDATLEFIFPQLKESEEEKRKRAVAVLEQQRYYWAFDGPADKTPPATKREDLVEAIDVALSCLEKQKEQIPYTDFVIKPHKGDDNNPYDMRVSEAQEYAIKRGFGIPFNDGEVYVDERHLTQTIGNILRWADEHPKEQKPAWRIWRNGACGNSEGNPIALVKESCGYKLVSYLCADGEKYIMLSDLEKLPGYNEK